MNFYDLIFTDTTGSQISMTNFRGMVVLIVNTATRCGLAPQFEGIERLHQTYRNQGLAVIGFPCNQFLNQEPESDASMVQICNIRFGVTFTLSEKIEVNGRNTHPVFVYLKKKLPGGLFGSTIKWNFTKFLITAQGVPFRRYAPTVSPDALEKEIVTLLADKASTDDSAGTIIPPRQ